MSKSPSSGASLRSRHLLPRGEKEGHLRVLKAPAKRSGSPSPLVGEGGPAKAGPGEGDTSNPRLKGYARAMRRAPTEAEQKLWLLLRNRRFVNHKFRRQVPVGSYIADFVCYSARLIIELDGSQHAENLKDVRRDKELAHRGFRVLRVWNSDLLSRPDAVLEAVWVALNGEYGP